VFLLTNCYQFCPLLELDGYFLLVDWLEKPMLRARSFAFVRGQLWSKLRQRSPLRGDERLLACFGIAAGLWSGIEVLLAVRIWETRLSGLIVEAWTGGSLLTRAALLLLLLMLGSPILLGLWSLAVAVAHRSAAVAHIVSG